MANERLPIFNEKAYEKLRNPDDLDKYVRVTKPSAWVALLGCIVLLVGILVWGIFGTVSSNIETECVAIPSGEVICLISLDDIGNVNVGDPISTESSRGFISRVGSLPLSRTEVRDLLQSDFLTDVLIKPGQNWAFVVYTDELKVTEGLPEDCVIRTQQVAPLSALFDTGEVS